MYKERAELIRDEKPHEKYYEGTRQERVKQIEEEAAQIEEFEKLKKRK